MIGKTIIVDLDGTLANSEHRLHHLHKEVKDYHSFHLETMDDEIFDDIDYIIKTLYDSGMDVVVCTAREKTDTSYKLTREWLRKTKIGLIYEKLYMRPNGDFRPDDEVKYDLYLEMLSDGYNPVLAFEDRNSVVNMWRKLGLRCLQVADGDF